MGGRGGSPPRQSTPDAVDVTDAVAVATGEAADIDLVDDGIAPPRVIGKPRTGRDLERIYLTGCAERDGTHEQFLSHHRDPATSELSERRLERAPAPQRRQWSRMMQKTDELKLACRSPRKNASPLRLCSEVAALPRAGAGRAADNELGLEDELVEGGRQPTHLADQQFNHHSAHRLDRLPKGR